MTARKNYNSVIFLTTLSVYLGLVLVGAPAPVLAQAVLTGRIEVKDKIEKKDDLDKNPDGNPNLKEIDVSTVLIDFLNDLQNLKISEPKIYEQEKNFYARREQFVYFDNSIETKPRAKNFPSKLDDSFEKLFGSLDNQRLRSLSDFIQEAPGKKSLKRVTFEIYNSLETPAKLLISLEKNSSQNARLLTDQLNMEFRFRANNTEQKLAKLIYENTQARCENNQVFIVTRLPRGSLDALLTQKSAQ